MNLILSNIEMSIMEWFYSIGNGFLNKLFYIITQFGGSIVLIGILGIIYWCIDKEKGEKIGFSILTSICLNGVLKSIFTRKRPFQHEGKEHLQKLDGSDGASGSSFPSGHSQNAGSLYTALYKSTKNKFIRICCILLIIFIPISRLYLGVHFPSDVIVGSLLGILTTSVCFFLLNKFNKHKMVIYVLTIIIFTQFIIFTNAEHDFCRGYGLLIGFVGGIAVENKFIRFETSVGIIKKLLRVAVGILIVGGAFFITNLIPKSISHIPVITILIYGLIAFLTIGVVPLMFKSPHNKNGI